MVILTAEFAGGKAQFEHLVKFSRAPAASLRQVNVGHDADNQHPPRKNQVGLGTKVFTSNSTSVGPGSKRCAMALPGGLSNIWKDVSNNDIENDQNQEHNRSSLVSESSGRHLARDDVGQGSKSSSKEEAEH